MAAGVLAFTVAMLGLVILVYIGAALAGRWRGTAR